MSPENMALVTSSLAAVIQLWTTFKERSLSKWKTHVEERTGRPVDLSYFDTPEGREYQARLWTAFLLTGDPRKRRGCLAAMLRMAQDDSPRGEVMRTLVGLVAELDAFDYELLIAVARLYDQPDLGRNPSDQEYVLTDGDELKGGVACYRIVNYTQGRDLAQNQVRSLQETEEISILNCHLMALPNKFALNSQGILGGWTGVGPPDSEALRAVWFAPTTLARSIVQLVSIGLEGAARLLPILSERDRASDAGA